MVINLFVSNVRRHFCVVMFSLSRLLVFEYRGMTFRSKYNENSCRIEDAKYSLFKLWRIKKQNKSNVYLLLTDSTRVVELCDAVRALLSEPFPWKPHLYIVSWEKRGLQKLLLPSLPSRVHAWRCFSVSYLLFFIFYNILCDYFCMYGDFRFLRFNRWKFKVIIIFVRA